MKLTAYTIHSTWQTWDHIAGWRVDGPTLFLTWDDGTPEGVALPATVIGLADNTPPRPVPLHFFERKKIPAADERPTTRERFTA